MPEFIMPHGYHPDWTALDDFTKGYVEAMFFTEEDELGDAGFPEMSPEALKATIDDCAQFQADNQNILEQAYENYDYGQEQAGRDLWFTRNGHGTGFWSRGQIPDQAQPLTEAAKSWPGYQPYVGDDGLIYI